MPATLEDDEIAAILVKADELAAWAADVKVYPDGRAVFTFHNGVEVSTEI